MNPKARNENETGLIEYLEDIIGSNKYVEEIESLDKQLEEGNEKRIEQTNRVKSSYGELLGLADQRDSAIDWIMKERKNYKLQTFRLFVDLDDEVQKYNELSNVITETRNKIKQLRAERIEKMMKHKDTIE